MAAGADKISTTMSEFRDQVAQMSQVIAPAVVDNSRRDVATTHPDGEALI
jgi:hypothetical protein